jgi:hypothetical protein
LPASSVITELTSLSFVSKLVAPIHHALWGIEDIANPVHGSGMKEVAAEG